ncbi:MAG: hypothetical protein JW795_04345 [Chitinivibrionales bacterium]|nr:hypothetical protein [Chitinivibrionales bacterium]
MANFEERFESTKIEELITSSLPYFLKSYQTISSDSGLFGKVNPKSFNMKDVALSSPVIEYVIRPHLNILCTLSLYLYKNNDKAIGGPCSKDELLDKIKKGLQWLCSTHVTGTVDIDHFLERKRWGENWRSGLWAGLMGLCAFCIRSQLDEGLLEAIQRVISFEADRFIGCMPPSGYEFDTKLEENAQDTLAVAWAYNLFPDHPHGQQWLKVVNIWALNIASTYAHRSDHTEHLDRSISHWITTQTLYPDMTAENHGFFNPEILGYSMWVVLSMLAFHVHERKIPGVFQRQVHQETFDILLRFVLPNGLVYTPSSTDLPLFVPHPFIFAWGLWHSDSRAQRMMQSAINWIEETCPLSNDKKEPEAPTQADVLAASVPFVLGFEPLYEGWELYFQSQVALELSMLLIVPQTNDRRFYSIGQIDKVVETRQNFPYIQLCYCRNTVSTRSVAWKALGKHPIIGLAIHANPELLVPYAANILGIPKIETNIKSWEVLFHCDNLKTKGFDTFGRINYYDSADGLLLHRDVRVMTWGNDGLIIFDRIVTHREFYFYEQYLSPLHIVNDVWTQGKVNLVSGSLRETIAGSNTSAKPINCPSYWASVNDTVLVQFIWQKTKGLTFIPGNSRNSPRYWKNSRLDILAINVEGRLCNPDDVVYEIGFFVGNGKGPRPFKSVGTSKEFFRGLIIMDGKYTDGLD